MIMHGMNIKLLKPQLVIGLSVTEFTDVYNRAEASWPQAVTLMLVCER
jgi:hypothetical protein